VLARFYGQHLSWHNCGNGFTCSSLTVPIDYAHPDAGTMKVAVIRERSTGSHRGSLIVNPGGPGASGVSFVRDAAFAFDTLNQHLDLVGFDPRGTHDSTPVTCSDDPADDAKLSPVFPVTEAQEAAAIAQVGEVTARCAQHAGPLLAHMSTANVARDLDLLRRAVGDPQLTYIGTSYGTHLGEVYANLFPQRVRAMVLDGVVQPQEWTTGRLPGQGSEPYIYRLGSYLGARRWTEEIILRVMIARRVSVASLSHLLSAPRLRSLQRTRRWPRYLMPG